MNWERMKGSLMQLEGELMERWGQLMHSEPDVVLGWREQMKGKVEEHFGETKEIVSDRLDRMTA